MLQIHPHNRNALTQPLIHALTHMHSHTCTHTHVLSLSFSQSFTHTHIVTDTHTLTLSLSLTHCHSHRCTYFASSLSNKPVDLSTAADSSSCMWQWRLDTLKGSALDTAQYTPHFPTQSCKLANTRMHVCTHTPHAKPPSTPPHTLCFSTSCTAFVLSNTSSLKTSANISMATGSNWRVCVCEREREES